MGMEVCPLWQIVAVSDSVTEDITCLRMVHSNRTGPFSLGEGVPFPEVLLDR